jgi:hypothetical protein
MDEESRETLEAEFSAYQERRECNKSELRRLNSDVNSFWAQ